MKPLRTMMKSQLLDLVREQVGPGNARRAIDNGTVRVMGKFAGRCGNTWYGIRIVDHPKGRRRVTVIVIGEFFVGQERGYTAGRIPRVDWPHWFGYGASGMDIDAAVMKRLTDKYHTEEHHADRSSMQ